MVHLLSSPEMMHSHIRHLPVSGTHALSNTSMIEGIELTPVYHGDDPHNGTLVSC
ncbi:hypothetical protein CC2G_004466 [Coprinopsis cinerea AmutBmut pab1-1]|nr:hypothetical protein CC2G_004466 [Coprinopsis cinerea AmutBmut pab1-1]